MKSLYDLGASDKVNTAATQPGGAGLASGLVGYWKLDENTGTSAGDASTNGNAGTLTNGPTWTTGRIGSAVTFDGTNDEITIPHSAALEPDDLTVSLWVKRNSSQGANDQIIGKDTSASGSNTWSYALEWDSGGTAIQWEVDDNSLASFPFVTSAVIPDATWTLVTGTYRNSTKVLELFVNGVSQGTTTLPGTRDKGTTGIVLGRYNGGGGEFNGSINEVRIYNRALSADEVGQLYRLTSPTGTDTSLKGYWSFNGSDTTGTTAYDRSGAGNNGTLTNGPTITEGKLGQALNFDGTNDYVSTDVPVSGDLTLSAWIYPTNGQEYEGIITRPSQYEAGNYRLLFRNGSHLLEYQFTGGSVHTSNSSIPYDQWSYVAVTFNDAANSVVIYVNGVVDYTGTETGSPSTANAYYGTLVGASNIVYNDQYFEGKVDEARIYNRALSAKEIAALYNMGR